MTEPKKTRTRRRQVETPGTDETNDKAPKTQTDVETTQEEQNLAEVLSMKESGTVDFVGETQGAIRHAGYEPQIGDQWAGKTLTDAGWLLDEHPHAVKTRKG